MPRRRYVHPETWTDDKFVQLSPLARLLYIGMWTYACDNGHVEDNALQLKMRILPADNCECADLLRELIDRGRVEVKNGYLKIPTLREHQPLDKRWIRTCEWCSDDPDSLWPLGSTREHASTHVDSGEHTPAVAVASAFASDIAVAGSASDEHASPPVEAPEPARKRAAQLSDDWTPNEHHRRLAATYCVNLDEATASFRDYYRANGKPMKDWDASFNNWIRREKGAVKPKADGPDPNAWMRRRPTQ